MKLLITVEGWALAVQILRTGERRVRGNSLARCETGEKSEITSNTYLSSSLGGARGQATEIEIAARHILKTRDRLNKILAENTGQPFEVMVRDTERDNYMSAEEAVAYGLVDQVIERIEQ